MRRLGGPLVCHCVPLPHCQESKQYLCLVEDSLEEEVCEEIDRLYKCLDRDDDKKRKKSSSGSSSASSSSSSKKKKQSKKPKGKKEKEKEKGKKEKKEKNEPKKKKNKGGKPEVPKVGFSLLCLVFDCKVEETEQEKADRAALAEATKQAQKASLCPNLFTWGSCHAGREGCKQQVEVGHRPPAQVVRIALASFLAWGQIDSDQG